MNRIKRIALGALAAAGLALTPATGSAGSEAPDATLELSGGAVALGLGVSWSHGTLRYRGKAYPIQVKGLSVAGVGAGRVTATGEVFHLERLSQFSGTYAAVSAGAAVARGGGVSAMRNEHGVVIEMRATTRGADLQLGVDGLEVALG